MPKTWVSIRLRKRSAREAMRRRTSSLACSTVMGWRKNGLRARRKSVRLLGSIRSRTELRRRARLSMVLRTGIGLFRHPLRKRGLLRAALVVTRLHERGQAISDDLLRFGRHALDDVAGGLNRIDE